MTHQPKGSMCISCGNANASCASRPFASMPVIKTYPDGVKAVKCTGHVHAQASTEKNEALQQVLVAALEEARSAINSMKVEAETAGQGDEQMMLEACETISNEGLQADMAIRAALASAPRPVPSAAGPCEAPEGWRNKFAEAVYADLEAADNQDVPLEEYPARILKALDSIVGPRHPTVIHWRNDAIQACIAIACKYCRDPESFQYLKQDLQSLIFAAPKAAPVAQWDAEDAARYRFLAAHCRSTPEHWGGRWSIVVEGPAPKSHDSEDDFDAAIDAARAQAKEGDPQ